MKWKKLGLVYNAVPGYWWSNSHAMVPTPVDLRNGSIRIFYTACDSFGIGRACYLDVSSSNPLEIIDICTSPVLDIGEPGSFDENGVLPCSVVNLGGGKMYMYYVGFELGTKIRYRLFTGLAISDNYGKTFTRFSRAPILDRSNDELHFRGGPCCLYNKGVFRLWYVAGSAWEFVNGKQMPVYDIRYLESSDGISWSPQGLQVLPITDPDEHGFGRPAVVVDSSGLLKMFYSVRRRSFSAYRLGYAESYDGISWCRMDSELNLDVSQSGFDSTAIMYAAPIYINGSLYVFYNGNDFGRDGFAAAVLLEE